MGTLITIVLVMLAISLFLAAKQGWIHNETLQTGANVAAIIAVIAAIAVFIVPTPAPTEFLPDQDDSNSSYDGQSLPPDINEESTQLEFPEPKSATLETIYNCPTYKETKVGVEKNMDIVVSEGEIAFINALGFDELSGGVFVTITGPYTGNHTLRDGAFCGGIPVDSNYEPVREQRREVQDVRTWEISLP